MSHRPSVVSAADLQYQFVTDKLSPLRADWMSLFRQVFGAPPYNETFEDHHLIEVWDLCIENGCVVMAVHHDEAVGFANGYRGLHHEKRIEEFVLSLDSCPFDPQRTFYMSDFGVRNDYRCHGIGARLIVERARWALESDCVHYAMRTASEGSHSAGIYKKLGAVELPTRQFVGEEGIPTDSDFRTWLYGELTGVVRFGE